MPVTDYIPARDADLLSFASNFSTKITATPATYGVTAPQAVTYAALFSDFSTKLGLATAPATRTSVTVAAKDVSRQALVANTRQLANICQETPGMLAASIAALGLTVRQTVPTPIPAPTTKPVISLERTLSQQIVFRFRDESTPASRAKPFGAVALEFRSHVGTAPPASPAAAEYRGDFSRLPFTVDYDAADVGKTAYSYARWKTAKGLTGPWSDPLTVTVTG